MALIGIGQMVGADGWTNDLVGGLILFAGAPVLCPPLLRTIRNRWPVLAPRWVPIIYLPAVAIFALLISLPFTPSHEQQRSLAAMAVARARSDIARRDVTRARYDLRKFVDRRTSDPRLSTLFDEIEAAEATPSVPVKSVTPTSSPETVSSMADANMLDAQAQLTTMKALQDRMNDPTSLLVVGDTVEHTKDLQNRPILKSYVKYRGSNAFGGTVTEAAVVTLSSDGTKVLSFTDATAALR